MRSLSLVTVKTNAPLVGSIYPSAPAKTACSCASMISWKLERCGDSRVGCGNGMSDIGFHSLLIDLEGQFEPTCRIRILLVDALHIYMSGPEMIRTSDTRFRKPLLYPLSYGARTSRNPIYSLLEIVGGCRSFLANFHEVKVFVNHSIGIAMHH